MEADSTTYENNPKSYSDDEPFLPFSTCPGNLKLYKEFIANNGDKLLECQVIERLQSFGLLPSSMKCLSNKPDCKLTCRVARVVDRVQWFCEGCGKRQPIRSGSFFLRLHCTIVQALQIILGWCEDAALDVVAEYFGIKPKSVTQVYEKLDELAVKEYNKHKLGGANSVVLAEMYPDCMNRLSPDTTDQAHGHRVLMLADTNHIPTYYRLHLIKEDARKTSNTAADSNKMLKSQIEEVVSRSVHAGSVLVTGPSVPTLPGAYSLQQLPHCDSAMQHFLSTRIWRQATVLCCASRDLCAGAALPALCAPAVQRYLHASLYRLRFGDGFYQHVLETLAAEYTSSGRDTAAVEL